MNLTLKQYRTIDIGILSAVLAASEALIAFAARVWFSAENYILSPTAAVICIVMMRWGLYAVIPAVCGGLAMCIASGAGAEQFAVYCIGGCFSLAAYPLLKRLGKETVRKKAFLTFFFTAAVFLSIQLGRWLVGLMFGGTAATFVTLLVTDSLSLLFAAVAVQLARHIDGLFEDQLGYLRRTQAERRRSQQTDEVDTEYGG